MGEAPAEATDEEVAEAAESPDEPDLSDDDMVDIPDDVAEQVAQADAEEADDADGGEETGDDTDEEADSVPSTSAGEDRTSLGDVYCNALGMATVAAKDRHGSGIDDREAAMDEYADMARQLDLDEYVDDYVAMHGGPDELSPGQAIVVFSVVFGASVMVEDPELSGAVLEGVGA